jgi:Fur family peroxide stress response transcriptional regulator
MQNSSEREKYKAAEQMCRGLGFKLTHQRLEILRQLAIAKDHPSAEDIYKRVKPKISPISFDTVYRTLALFERSGIIARVHHLDDKTRYDPNTTKHNHMVCTKCKKIQDFSWPTLDGMEVPGETKEWGEIQGKYLELRGICRECLRQEKKAGTRESAG